ncbi:MAG: Ig-like domain-containing protein [Bacilli bacterium]|jgi:S1-C subfamily serine protease|nr:PDZ domain-containing protein [Acholeplasmataceae bacterium]HOA78723.1 Ig-like domain-containing protein [Bacilli bacterium]HPZ27402.1 Ig-like domain-containing protein [Bacilli bacterium]HQC89736.1 Ig-like domain-containing protein [Bacilli bacterium]
MKKTITLIFIMILTLGFAGCDFKINNGKPIGIGDEIPTAVIVKSEDNRMKLETGETLRLSATVFPETAPQGVVWSSENESVATVDQTGLVLGISSGTVTIKAAAASQKSVDGSIFLTVVEKPVPPTAITINGPASLFTNETVKYSYEVEPADATFAPEWISGDESVFTVDANGRVTGVAPGNAELLLQAGDVTDRLTITVKARAVDPESIAIVGRNEVEVGRSIPLKVVFEPAHARDDVVWTLSGDLSAAEIIDGRVYGKAPGNVIVTATSLINESLSASIEIAVIDYLIDTSNLQSQIIDVINKTKNSILGVTNYKYADVDGEKVLKKSSLGSGSVYDVWFVLKDGSVVYDLDEIVTFEEIEKYRYLLMTNKHVVKEANQVKVYLHEEEIEIDADIRQMDDRVDLAVIYFEYDRYIRPLKVGDSSALVSGEFVIAIGNPSGYDFSSSATFGIVSHPQRYLSEDTDGDGTDDWHNEYIQHDAAINPGNSGGPLLNLAGEIVGMNTLKFASTDIDNMGFSIPSNVITGLLPLLEEGDVPKRIQLGVRVIEVKGILESPSEESPEIPAGIKHGLYVDSVDKESHAERAGILENDIILFFNGAEIRKTLDLRLQLLNLAEGSGVTVPIRVYRDGEIIDLYLELEN